MAISFDNISPKLDKILEQTYGQLIFQEQVTEIAQQLAGWTAGQADKLRKAIGRKIPEEMAELIPKLHKAFVDYGKITDEQADMLCTGIQNCASYSFNKSHSVEYGLIAYQTAYLKANYPLEYMCALLNANSDNEEDIVKYKAECERMGIEILPPSVKVGNLDYIPENGNIRMGLSSIKGINDLHADFFGIKEALIKSGACDCFGLSRKEMLLRALNVYKDIKAYDTKISNSYAKLGTKISELEAKKDGTKIKANLAKQIENLEVTIARYTKERDVLVGLTKGEYNEVEGEKEVLGFTFQDEFKYYDTSKFPLYSERVSGVQTFWANIISVKTIKDKNGNLMAFVSAVPYKHKQKVEFVVFASTYKKITTPIVEGVALLKVNKKNQLVDWVEGKNV